MIRWQAESPESWFEDFGEGRLVCSEASIALDPDFAAVVDTTKYHVFLTGLDGVFDLSAADKTPQGFGVRAATGTDGTFAWRVVAKRKDIAAHVLVTDRGEPIAELVGQERERGAAEAVQQAGRHSSGPQGDGRVPADPEPGTRAVGGDPRRPRGPILTRYFDASGLVKRYVREPGAFDDRLAEAARHEGLTVVPVSKGRR